MKTIQGKTGAVWYYGTATVSPIVNSLRTSCKSPLAVSCTDSPGSTMNALVLCHRNGTGCQTNTGSMRRPSYCITHWAHLVFLSLWTLLKPVNGTEKKYSLKIVCSESIREVLVVDRGQSRKFWRHTYPSDSWLFWCGLWVQQTRLWSHLHRKHCQNGQTKIA